MQALRIIRSLVRAVAASALGLLLSLLLFNAWTAVTGEKGQSQSAEPSSREIQDLDLACSQPSTSESAEQRESGSEIMLASAVREHQEVQGESAESSMPSQESRAGPRLEAQHDTLARLLSIADEAFENGSNTECVQRYQFLLPNVQGETRRLVAVKLGISAENLSDLELAARAYSASLEMQLSDDLASFSRIRIALILASQGDLLGARSHLADWLMAGGGVSELQFGQQALHLLAEIQARIACGSTTSQTSLGPASLVDDRPMWPIRHDPPDMTLAGVQSQPATGAAVSAAASRIEIIDQFSLSAEETFATLEVTGRPLATVCEALASKAGMPLNWSDTGYRRAEDRRITISMSDVSLAVLLDLMTRGAGLVWLETEDGLFIASEQDLNSADLQLVDLASARRLLLHAIAEYPDCDRLSLTTMSLANLDFQQRRFAEASQRYEELVAAEFNRLWVAEAAINLGKARLLMNDLEGSAEAFIAAGDSAFGHPLQPVALLYAGRLYVCLNRVDDAVPVFSRAWTLSQHTDLAPDALICLSSAYAHLDNPMTACRLLVENRDLLSDVDPYHDLAALIGCHCRYSIAQSADRKTRDGRDLLDALVNVDPTNFFAMQGWSLVVDSYRDLGLNQEARATLERCLVSCEACPFRNEMFRQAGGDASHGTARHWDEDEFADVAALLGDASLHRIERIRSLLNAGEYSQLETEAAELLQQPMPEQMQDELFDLLGRGYQRQEDHYLAALCFARINPFSERALQLRDAFFEDLAIDSEGIQP